MSDSGSHTPPARADGSAMIDRLLDRILPTSQQPDPHLTTATDRDVLVSRLGAAAIDLAICYLMLESPLIYLFSQFFPAVYRGFGGWVVLVSLLVLLPIYATYGFVCEWFYGRTPGKVNRGLLVVMADGRQCTLRAAAVRNLLRYVDLLGVPPIVVGLLTMLATEGRRVGDLAADTVVVRAGAPATVDAAVTTDLETGPAERGG